MAAAPEVGELKEAIPESEVGIGCGGVVRERAHAWEVG
jgi:hypothetical protein